MISLRIFHGIILTRNFRVPRWVMIWSGNNSIDKYNVSTNFLTRKLFQTTFINDKINWPSTLHSLCRLNFHLLCIRADRKFKSYRKQLDSNIETGNDSGVQGDLFAFLLVTSQKFLLTTRRHWLTKLAYIILQSHLF